MTADFCCYITVWMMTIVMDKIEEIIDGIHEGTIDDVRIFLFLLYCFIPHSCILSNNIISRSQPKITSLLPALPLSGQQNSSLNMSFQFSLCYFHETTPSDVCEPDLHELELLMVGYPRIMTECEVRPGHPFVFRRRCHSANGFRSGFSYIMNYICSFHISLGHRL